MHYRLFPIPAIWQGWTWEWLVSEGFTVMIFTGPSCRYSRTPFFVISPMSVWSKSKLRWKYRCKRCSKHTSISIETHCVAGAFLRCKWSGLTTYLFCLECRKDLWDPGVLALLALFTADCKTIDNSDGHMVDKSEAYPYRWPHKFDFRHLFALERAIHESSVKGATRHLLCMLSLS